MNYNHFLGTGHHGQLCPRLTVRCSYEPGALALIQIVRVRPVLLLAETSFTPADLPGSNAAQPWKPQARPLGLRN